MLCCRSGERKTWSHSESILAPRCMIKSWDAGDSSGGLWRNHGAPGHDRRTANPVGLGGGKETELKYHLDSIEFEWRIEANRGSHHSKMLGEGSRCRRQSEQHRPVLIMLACICKPEIPTMLRMDHYMQVSLLEVQRGHEIPFSNAVQDGLERLHLEPLVTNEGVEILEIQDGPPPL